MEIILPVFVMLVLGMACRKGKLVLIMLVMVLLSFVIGFLVKPLMKNVYQKYLPFMVSMYEGRMLAYPLYTNL